MKMSDDLKKNLIITGKLTAICFAAVLLLTLVNALTYQKIKANEAEVESRAIAELFPGGNILDNKKITFDNPYTNKDQEYYYEIVDNSGSLLGYVVSVLGTGYAGDMKVMIAMDRELVITKMKLLKNNETPGLGKKAEKSDYMDKFIGTNSPERPFPVSKADLGDKDRDAVTGATITFNGITFAGQKAILLMENIVKGN